MTSPGVLAEIAASLKSLQESVARVFQKMACATLYRLESKSFVKSLSGRVACCADFRGDIPLGTIEGATSFYQAPPPSLQMSSLLARLLLGRYLANQESGRRKIGAFEGVPEM